MTSMVRSEFKFEFYTKPSLYYKSHAKTGQLTYLHFSWTDLAL